MCITLQLRKLLGKLLVNGDLTAVKVVDCHHSLLVIHHQRVCLTIRAYD